MVLRLSSFPSDVRGVVLTGLSTATNAVVAATDTVLAALGKLQAQLANYTLNAAAAITGGSINSATVGATTPSTGAFTSLSATGAAALSNGATIGTNTSAPSLNINGIVGFNRALFFQTSGVFRWEICTDAFAETGSNAGSQLEILRFSDAGTQIDAPVVINRATGLVTIADGLTVSGGTVSGAGITSLFASPPAIGGTAPAAGTFSPGLTLSHQYNNVVFCDAVTGPTSGGYHRITSSGAGSYVWQINTASAGDFSAITTAFSVGSTGQVQFGVAPAGPGTTLLFASPPAIGGTAAAAGTFTALTAASGTVSNAVINTAALDTSLDLNFLSGVLDSRITFTRASTATYFDATGTMQTAAAGVARFDHAPTLVASASAPYVYTPLGLLIEESRTNVALYSGNIANAAWVLGSGVVAGPTVTANAAVAPDGTTTAAQIVYPAVTGASAYSASNQGVIVTAAVYSFSVYLKGAAGGETLYIYTTPNGSTYYRTPVTLTTAWQRFTLTTPALTAAAWYFAIGTDLRDGSQTAKSAQTIYAWGAQVELGAFPTSYIPTTSAAVTRAADVATMPVGSWFNAAAGTLVADANFLNNNRVGYPGVFQIDSGSNTNRLLTYALTGSDTIAANSDTAQFNMGSFTAGTIFRSGIAYSASGFTAAALGVATSLNGHVSSYASYTTLRLGVADASGSNVADGYIVRVRYWPRALSTAELQTVTASATPALLNLAIDQCPIGATNPSSGAFTTLAASSTVSGAGFSTYLASPPAIGGTAPSTGAFTALTASGGTISNAVINTAALDTSLDLNFLSGVLDSRISFTRGSVATYFDANGVMQTAAANVARFDHAPTLVASASAPYVFTPLGLLIEESRTNSIRNSTMVGAVAGTPGTLPTNWAANTISGVTNSVVGTGTEGGIAYIDLSYAGTPASSGQLFISMEDGTISLTSGTTYSQSIYVRLTAGSLTNTTLMEIFGVAAAVTVTPTGAALVSQRTINVQTAASTTTTQPYFAFNVTSGQAINLTLRIGAPQFETGAFATSYIPTTSAAVTRAADVATMPVGSWFTQGLGSLDTEAMVPVSAGSQYPNLASISDGTNSNYVSVFYDGPYTRFESGIVVGGTANFSSFSLSTAGLTAGSVAKTVLAWSSGTASFEVNPGSGSVAVATASATIPSGLTTLTLGCAPNLGVVGARYLRRVRYWPRALSTTELQVVTASATPALLNLAIDQCPIGATNPSSGAFTTITLSQAEIDASAYTTAPVTGGTVTIPGTAARCVINPAGTLAALTVVSPAALSLGANSVQSLDILFTQAITSLTWKAGSGTTFGGAAMPSTVALGTCVRLLWVQSLSQWLHTTVV
jgi:hypothetical protein